MLRGAQSFLAGNPIPNTAANHFISLASKTLEIYLKTNTQLNENGKYMSSFDSQDFLDSFEELAKAKYRSQLGEDDEYNREPYAGAGIKDLNAVFDARLQKMNKPLSTLWMEQLNKGTMDIDKLHRITKKDFDSMDKTWNKNEHEMAGSLTNVIAAYEAMKQLRDSRKGFFGWLWKLFNWKINAKEEEYFNELSTQVDKLRKDFNVEKISAELTGKTVLGRDANAKKNVIKTQFEQVSIPQESPQANPVESNAKSAKMKPVASQIEDKFDDISSEMLVELYRKTSGDQPSGNETQQEKENREQRELNRTYALKFLLRGMKDTITELNQQFDEAVANGADPKTEMKNVVREVFKATVGRFSGNVEDGKLEKAEAFKNAAQIIVDNFTAAAIYPNELKETVNTYINQNVTIYKEIVAAGKEYSKEIDNYKKVLEDDHELVFNDDNLFTENNANKSAPVNQQSQIKAPSLDKK
jgi:hypothetical protein